MRSNSSGKWEPLAKFPEPRLVWRSLAMLLIVITVQLLIISGLSTQFDAFCLLHHT